MSYDEIIDIFMSVLSGLRIIHNSGFVHFDLKPNNIFIRNNGIPCIIGLDAMQKVVHDAEGKAKVSFMVATDGYSPSPYTQVDKLL